MRIRRRCVMTLWLAALSLGGGPGAVRADWPMAGADPQRSSRVAEAVRGDLAVEWHRPIKDYISQKVPIIAADGVLYVSTAGGLYALEAATGADRWVYPTDMPIGHSPTVADGVVYFGCHDRRIHAVEAASGKRVWASQPAGAGYHINPLVVAPSSDAGQKLVIAGNRDGWLYALDAKTGGKVWRFQTGGPVLFSAAYYDGVVYFASEDCRGYAVKIKTGEQTWKTEKLPTAGFHSWWPVVDRDFVVLVGSQNRPKWHSSVGEKPVEGAGREDCTYFVVDRVTGKVRYQPLPFAGTYSGNRYPPAIGADGLFYQNVRTTGEYFSLKRSAIIGLDLKTGAQSPVYNSFASDEPVAQSFGGDILYIALCVNRRGEGLDLKTGKMWKYFGYDLHQRYPEILSEYLPEKAPNGQPETSTLIRYGGWNGVYGQHGDQNPFVSCNGKLYHHNYNQVICFSAAGGGKALPPAGPLRGAAPAPALPAKHWQAILDRQIEAMLQAGHLRPGLHVMGIFDWTGTREGGDSLSDYFSNPGMTIEILCRAVPHVAPELREPLKKYIQAEFARYPPDQWAHIGWRDGAAREFHDIHSRTQEKMNAFGPRRKTSQYKGYSFPPQNNYALYQYAKLFGPAAELLGRAVPITYIPDDNRLQVYPQIHNAYLAGLIGLKGLYELAGKPVPAELTEQLDRLLKLRVEWFSKDRPEREKWDAGALLKYYQAALSVSRNFLYLTPEVAAYLREHALAKVQGAVAEYERVAPFWFVTKAEEAFGEGTLCPLWDYHTLFAARAWILRDSYEMLEKYIDAPAFVVGDLFYIQNVILALEAAQPPSSDLASKP